VALADDVVLPEHLPRSITEPGRRSGSPLPPAVAPAGAPSPASAAPMSSGRERVRVEVEVELGTESMDLKALTQAAGEQAERAILETMLRQGHSQAQLARRMNIDPKTLRGKLRKYGLDSEPRSG
jgi:DNA-binding NtrC family response regulator